MDRPMNKKLHTLRKPLVLTITSALLLVVYFTGALTRFENQAQDLLYRDFGLIHPDVFVFGIDEESLIEFGPLQFWPRQRMADAIAMREKGNKKPKGIPKACQDIENY